MREPTTEGWTRQLPGDVDCQVITDGGIPISSSARSRSLLPPEGSEPAQLLALPGSTVEQYHRETIAAMVDELAPDCVVTTPPRENSARATLSRGFDIPVLSPTRGATREAVAAGDESIAVVTAPARQHRSGDQSSAGTHSHRVCLTTTISLDVDPYSRSTSIKGLGTYAESLPEDWSPEDTTHCSTALRAGYRTRVTVYGMEHSLVGIGRTEASLGVGTDGSEAKPTLVEIFPNGAVSCEDVDADQFGVRGIQGVGPKRAQTLRNAGYNSNADVAEADRHELTTLSGFGRATAASIQLSARAQANETVLATGDDSLPNGEPIFIDIETDGLEPSTVWLVGALDGGPEDGHYMPFTEQEPEDGSHLEAFLAWLEANARGRPIVAWNGHSFDFPVLRDQLQQHYPEGVSTWDNFYQFDLLWWARDKNGGNMALPGRTNKLDAVAEALGWVPQTTGIDGGVVAEVYLAYRRDCADAETPHEITEPDWERLEAYCEDDVRALATIYDAVKAASRRDPGSNSRSDTTDTGTQGALSDFT